MRNLIEKLEEATKKEAKGTRLYIPNKLNKLGLDAAVHTFANGEMADATVSVNKKYADDFFSKLEAWLKKKGKKGFIPEVLTPKKRGIGPHTSVSSMRTAQALYREFASEYVSA